MLDAAWPNEETARTLLPNSTTDALLAEVKRGGGTWPAAARLLLLKEGGDRDTLLEALEKEEDRRSTTTALMIRAQRGTEQDLTVIARTARYGERTFLRLGIEALGQTRHPDAEWVLAYLLYRSEPIDWGGVPLPATLAQTGERYELVNRPEADRYHQLPEVLAILDGLAAVGTVQLLPHLFPVARRRNLALRDAIRRVALAICRRDEGGIAVWRTGLNESGFPLEVVMEGLGDLGDRDAIPALQRIAREGDVRRRQVAEATINRLDRAESDEETERP